MRNLKAKRTQNNAERKLTGDKTEKYESMTTFSQPMPQPDKLDPRMEFVAVNWRPFFPRVVPFAWVNAGGALSEGPRARPSPQSITYVMRGNLCLAHRPAPRRTPAGPSPGHGSGCGVGKSVVAWRVAPPLARAAQDVAMACRRRRRQSDGGQT